jgi:hypothetical protein
MTSANQLYKASGSELGFKEWLKREQLKGALNKSDSKKEFVNATGSSRTGEIADTGLEEAEEALKVLLKKSEEQQKAKFRRGVLIGVVVGVAAKFAFDKYYKKK